MVEQGDRIKIDGRVVRVTSSWGQGKHMAWALDDGTTVLDLAEKIDGGYIELLPRQKDTTTKDSRKPFNFNKRTEE